MLNHEIDELTNEKNSPPTETPSTRVRFFEPKEDRLSAGLIPGKAEYYGHCWMIYRAEYKDKSKRRYATPTVVIPDPGDGSAGALTKRILDFLNLDSSDF